MVDKIQAPPPLEKKLGQNEQLSKLFFVPYDKINYEVEILLLPTYDNEEIVSIQLKDNIIKYKYDLDKIFIAQNKNNKFFKVYNTPNLIFNYLITLDADNIKIIKENFDYHISFEDEHIRKLTDNKGLIFFLNICMKNSDDIIKYLICENNKKTNEIKLLKEHNDKDKNDFKQNEEKMSENIKGMKDEINFLLNKLKDVEAKNNLNRSNIVQNCFFGILFLLVIIVFSILINTNNRGKNEKIQMSKIEEIAELQKSVNDLINKYYKIEKEIIKLEEKYVNLSKLFSSFEEIKNSLIDKIEKIQKYLLELSKFFNPFSSNLSDLFKKAKKKMGL